MSINGPPVVVKGDNVTIECAASKYNYHPDIKWTQQSLTNDKKIQINNNDSKETKIFAIILHIVK